ncbi:MAG: glycosyltransferase family 2 protein [Candidatus Omnitrophica bacterium]|nr:glycosyltransferase family 2 protein [Candidatus Omnitrophota bacterium]
MKICVIIPTYNEAKAIGKLVKQIRKQNLDVVVIDDGSSDGTAKISEDNGAVVLRNEVNQGKGASLIKGFNYALEKDFDAIITMDGDGQHLASDIPYFIQRASCSESEIIIGNRMDKTKSMPWIRICTNKFMSWLISSLVRQKIPDTQCGFRLIKKEVLEKVNLRTMKYETESEILIKAAWLGFKIESIPIKTIYNNKRSRINPIVDTLRFIRFIFREIIFTRYH